jgi:hypothetical protein
VLIFLLFVILAYSRHPLPARIQNLTSGIHKSTRGYTKASKGKGLKTSLSKFKPTSTNIKSQFGRAGSLRRRRALRSKSSSGQATPGLKKANLALARLRVFCCGPSRRNTPVAINFTINFSGFGPLYPFHYDLKKSSFLNLEPQSRSGHLKGNQTNKSADLQQNEWFPASVAHLKLLRHQKDFVQLLAINP